MSEDEIVKAYQNNMLALNQIAKTLADLSRDIERIRSDLEQISFLLEEL